DACRPHASLYTAGPLSVMGLERHATFFSLYMLVTRRPTGLLAEQTLICHDVRDAVEWGYAPWDEAALTFGYGYLLGLLQTGWRPPDMAGCAQEVRKAQSDVGATVSLRLQPLADSIIALLQ